MVETRHQTGEAIQPVSAGNLRVDHVVGGAQDTVRAGPGQDDRDTSQWYVARIVAQAVAVAVTDHAADAARAQLIAEVLARHVGVVNRNRSLVVERPVRVHSLYISRGGQGGGVHLDDVVAVSRAREGIGAVAVGNGAGYYHDACAVVQAHRYARQPFAGVVGAAAVEIVEDRAADGEGTGPVVAKVGRQVSSAAADHAPAGVVADHAEVVVGLDHAAGHSSRVHLDDVRAVGQAHEQVLAVGVRGGGGQQGHACAVIELHGHAGDTQLAGGLQAIAVGVVPHPVADPARIVAAEVVVVVLHARFNRQVDAGRRSGAGEARRPTRRLDVGDGVVAWRRQEDVLAVCAGDKSVDGVAVAVLQEHSHAGKRSLAAVEDAVVVDIVEDVACDAGRLDHAVVSLVVGLIGPQRHWQVFAHGVNHRADLTAGRAGDLLLRHAHDVLTRRQVGEGVGAGAVGFVGADGRLARINRAVAVGIVVEHQCSIGCATRGSAAARRQAIARVRNAVVVAIVPDEVADRAAPAIAEVDVVDDGRAGGQRDQCDVGGTDAVLVVRWVHSSAQRAGHRRVVGAGHRTAGVDRHTVVAGWQVVELVQTVGVRGGGRRRVPVAAYQPLQRHADAGQAGLACILHAVVVRIDPDEVADAARARRDQAKVGVVVLLASGQIDAEHRRCGRRVASRVGRRIGAHRIAARRQVEDAIGAVGVADIVGLAGVPLAVAVAIDVDPDAAQPHLACLQAVPVHVSPDEVADAGRGGCLRGVAGDVVRRRAGLQQDARVVDHARRGRRVVDRSREGQRRADQHAARLGRRERDGSVARSRSAESQATWVSASGGGAEPAVDHGIVAVHDVVVCADQGGAAATRCGAGCAHNIEGAGNHVVDRCAGQETQHDLDGVAGSHQAGRRRGSAGAPLRVEARIIGQRAALPHVAGEVGRRQRSPRVGGDGVAPENLGPALQRVDGRAIGGQRAAVGDIAGGGGHAAPGVGRQVVAPEVRFAVAAESVDVVADARQRAAPFDGLGRSSQRSPAIGSHVVAPEARLAIALQHVQVHPIRCDGAALLDRCRGVGQVGPGVASNAVAAEANAVAQHGVHVVHAADLEVLHAAALVEVVRGVCQPRPGVGGDVIAVEPLGVAFAGIEHAAAGVGQATAFLDAVGRLAERAPGQAGDAVPGEVLLVGAGQAVDASGVAADDGLAGHAGRVAAQAPGHDVRAAVVADQHRVGQGMSELVAARGCGRGVETKLADAGRRAGIGERLEHAGRDGRRDRVGGDARRAAANGRKIRRDVGDGRSALELELDGNRAAHSRRDRAGDERSRRALRGRRAVPKEDHWLLARDLRVAGGLCHHGVPVAAVPVDVVGPAAAAVDRHHHAIRGGAAREHDHVGVAVGGGGTEGLSRPGAGSRHRVPAPGAVAHLRCRRCVDAIGRQQVAAEGLEGHGDVLGRADQRRSRRLFHIDPGCAIPNGQPGAAAAGHHAHADAVAERVGGDGYPLRLRRHTGRRGDGGLGAPRGAVPDAVKQAGAGSRRLAIDHHGPAALRFVGHIDRRQGAAAGVQGLDRTPGCAVPDHGVVAAVDGAVDQR